MAPTYRLRTRIRLAAPRDEVFAFFASAENLAVVTPPELGFRIESPLPIAMGVGTLIDYTIRLYGVPMRWRTRIAAWLPGESFVDEQLRGPYASWVHRHGFADADDGGTIVEDDVHYRLPFGVLGTVAAPLVRRQLDRIFRFRGATVIRLLAAPRGGAASPVEHWRDG